MAETVEMSLFKIGADSVDVRTCFERFRVQNWEASMASCCTSRVHDIKHVTDPLRAPVQLIRGRIILEHKVSISSLK